MTFTRFALGLLLVLPSARASAADCTASCTTNMCTFDGILNAPLGAATLSVAECRLVIDGVSGTGQDGAVQDGLQSTYMVTRLATPNFSGSIQGTRADIRQVGVVNKEPGREISVTTIVNFDGASVRLKMDCAAVGVTSYAVEIYNAGPLVHAQPLATDTPILLFPKVDIQAMACAILPDGELYTTIAFGSATPLTIQTTQGMLGPFTGDCIKLRGFNPASMPTLQSAIENRFRNTGPVTITSLFAGPLPAVDHVCPDAQVPVRVSTWGRIKILYR